LPASRSKLNTPILLKEKNKEKSKLQKRNDLAQVCETAKAFQDKTDHNKKHPEKFKE
jgi:hypothetical protein